MGKISGLLDDVSDVIMLGARRTAGMRMVTALVCAVLLGLNLNVWVGGAWAAAYVIGEIWTQKVHRRFRADGGLSQAGEADHMWSIITWPKPEHETCVAPSIRRAKS